MRKFLGRIFFWNFERGTLPYDFIVLGIVAFVFLSPRQWFHDQAESGTPAATVAAVPCQADSANPRLFHCRVNAALLAPPPASPQLQEKAHSLLQRSAVPLKDRPFQILRMEPVLAGDGGVLYYEVSVQQ
ncbi:MAG TPA: hypothetical protein VL099_13065 [Candidatus Binatia bacterium]|nr:hypothetical protein [Candidatus Binatia bacterium]